MHISDFSTKIYHGLIIYIILIPYYYFSPSIFPASLITVLKYLPVLLLTLAIIPLLNAENLLFILHEFRITFYLIGIYFIIGLFSLWDSENKVMGLFRFAYYSYTSISAIYISLIIGKHFKKAYLIFRYVFFSVCVSSVYSFFIASWSFDLLSILNFFTWTLHLDYQNNRLSGTLGNPVAYGSLLMFTLPIITLYLVKARSLTYTFLISLVLFISLFNIVATSSRSAALISIPLLIFCLYVFPRQQGIRPKTPFKMLSFMALLCIILGLFTVSVEDKFDQLTNRLEAISDIKKNQSGRLSQYGFAFSSLREQPLLGIGAGQLVDSIRSGSYPRGIDQNSITTDNQFIMITVETGLLGLIAFVSLLSNVIVNIYNNLKSKISTEVSLYGWTCIASTMSLVLSMITWDAICQPTMRILFWTILGLGLSYTRTANTVSE
ncbi:MAG: hypothetical protein CMF52_02490 [Legionellales bacterium]|nr:hypothetical protein [Legionellales bacterium]